MGRKFRVARVAARLSTDCSVWGKVAGGLGAGVKGPALTLALVRVATGIACGPEHPLGPVCMVS